MALFRRSRTPDTTVLAPEAAAGPDAAREALIQAKGHELLADMNKAGSGMLTTAFWSDKLMDWAMQDEHFKVQLFRFIDTFPTLRTTATFPFSRLGFFTFAYCGGGGGPAPGALTPPAPLSPVAPAPASPPARAPAAPPGLK